MMTDHDAATTITAANATYLQPLQTAARGWIAQVAWSPSGTLLATASAGGVAIWRGTLESSPLFLKQHDAPVKSLAIAPNGVTLATASADATVKVWDLRAFSPEMTPLEVYDHGDSVESVTILRNGVVASACADGIVRLLHPSGTDTLVAHTAEVTSLSLTPGDFRLASGGRDNRVHIWNVTDRQQLATIDAHSDWVRMIAFHPRETLLLTASRDGSVRLWDTLRLPELTERAVLWHTGDVRAAAFSGDGALIATGSTDGAITLWETATGDKLATLAHHTKPVISLAFHPQNHWLASGGGDNQIALWGIPV